METAAQVALRSSLPLVHGAVEVWGVDEEVNCRERLGGFLRDYHRDAA